MGRYIQFDEDFLNRIRSAIDLPELISRDLVLKRSGDNFVACCPFHEEQTPSFKVSASKNTYHCYGCRSNGDAIEWLRQRHHRSFQDAVIELAGLCGIPLPVDDSADPAETVAKRKHLAELYQALQEACRVYRAGLNKSVQGRKYLEDERGLSNSTIDCFELGVVATGVLNILRGVRRDVLLASGLAAQRDDGQLYDRFRNRIMFPIRNESGNLVGFAGRSLIEASKKAPKYLNSPETVIFHKSRELYGLHLAKPSVRSTSVAVVVEGYFDVISLHQAGEARAVAPMGTSLTDHQVRRLLVHADTIVFAFDGDAAGRKAALAAAAVLLDEMKDGKSAKFIFLPEGEDPDSFVRANGIQVWLDAINKATPLSAFLADYVAQGLDQAIPESQVRAGEKARAILKRIAHAELFRRAMMNKLSEVVGLQLS